MGQAGRTGAIVGAEMTGMVSPTSIQMSKSTVFDQEQSEQWWIGT